MTFSRRALIQGGLALSATSTFGCADDPRVAPLWFSYGGKNREELLKLVAEYNLKESDHPIKPVFQGDSFELLAKFRTALAAGKVPAVTHVVAEVIPYLVKADVLLDLAELPNLPADLDMVPALAQSGTFGERGTTKLFGLPFNRSTPIAYVNRTLLGELSLEPPRTWEELRAFAKAGQRKDFGTGFACPVDWWFWVALVYQAGGELCDEDGNFTLGGEAGVEALAFWQTLVHTDKSMRPPTGRDYTAWQNVNQEFIAGRYPMIWNSSAFLRYLEGNAKFDVGAVPLPSKRRAGSPTGGTMFVVPKACPPRWHEAASRFLRFMMTPEASNQFATRTGYIPVTNRGLELLREDGHYARLPNDEVPLAQLSAVRPWPFSTKLFRVQREVVQARLESAVLEQEDARQTLTDACRAIAEDV